MGPNMTVDVDGDHLVLDLAPEEPRKPRRRVRLLWKILIGLALVVALLLAAGAVWFFVGRDHARQVSDDQALENLRSGGGATTTAAAGGPDVGVYSATSTGTESVGIPGLDEDLGPNAPVTVTQGDGGCFTYRVDFNSHYWRNWMWCPTSEAMFAVTRMESRTGRTLPGVSVESLATYSCDVPVPFLWADAASGDRRDGSCTGVVKDSDGVTGDAAVVEVLGQSTMTVGGETVDVVHLRSTETLSNSQTGSEIDEWWIDANTGLPVKIMIEISAKGTRQYTVTGGVDLTTLTPAT
jgi:hypothetical protein